MPIIDFHFNWTHVSLIAALTPTGFMFRLHEGRIKKDALVEFLHALNAHIERPLLVIWDGLRAHRSRLVGLDSLQGHIQIAFLLPYALTSIPSNTCGPCSSGTLWPTTARNKLKRAQKRPSNHCLLAGSTQRCNGVMNYGRLNNSISSTLHFVGFACCTFALSSLNLCVHD